MNAVLLSSLMLACAAGDPPAPKVPVAKDTTYVVGPLDKNGYIDYEAALNAKLSARVKPGQNANVLIWKALGPAPEGGNGMPPEYFRWLGIAEPPKDGAYFVDVRGYIKRAELDEEQAREFYDQYALTTQNVWAAKDFPHIAKWVELNEKPLAVVIEATKRPAYFNPLVSNRTDDISSLIGCLLPATQKCRELVAVLASRALLRTHEGKWEDAWADLVACHRLGRHLMHGSTLIESLVGIAIRSIATSATLAYLERADLTSAQLLAKLKELQGLPPVPPAADVIDLGQRLIALDALQLVRSGKGEPGHPTEEETRGLDMIEWAPAFRKTNKVYDRMAAALRLTDRAAREKQLDAIENELNEIVRKNRNLNALRKQVRDGNAAKVVGEEIGDVALALTMPGTRKCQSAFDRGAQIDRNLQVAFALAAYRKDTGRYPMKLADLAPKYLTTVPNDLFSNQPLAYKPADKGYFFYSVGENGKDEDGRWRHDTPRGDDLGVRMPLPKPKK